MLVKQRFYYRACNSPQDDVLAEKIVMILWPVRRDRSFKPTWILYKERTYFGMKKESGELRLPTFTNLAMILKSITLLDPRNSKNSKRTPYLL